MRRRLTVAMVAVVAGALIFAGLGSLVLVRISVRNSDVRQLTTQASTVAAVVARQETNLKVSPLRVQRDAQLIARVAGPFIEKVTFLAISPDSAVTTLGDAVAGQGVGAGLPPGTLVPGLTAADTPALLSAATVSGSSANRTFAVAPIALGPRVVAGLGLPAGTVVAIALVGNFGLPGLSGVYFVLAGVACLVVAVAVASLLSRRIAAPLAAAARATGRIAAGDLDTRVPVSERDGPELAQLGVAINTMAEALARSRRLERQFLLSISHDLRTPLTSIRGYAEAISDGAAPDPAKAAAVIAGEARRLERLFQDLLDLARLDARRFAIDVRRVDVAEVAASAAEGLRIVLDEAGLVLTVEPCDEPLPVAADGDRLAQVVANLVENAGKHARGAVRVATVTIPTEPGVAALLVEDDGPGIAPDDLPHVFERFYTTGRRPGSRGGGTGLGLAIVAELVQAMGGEVRAVSPTSPGGGTRMVVRLRRWASTNEPARPPTAQPSPPSAT